MIVQLVGGPMHRKRYSMPELPPTWHVPVRPDWSPFTSAAMPSVGAQLPSSTSYRRVRELSVPECDAVYVHEALETEVLHNVGRLRERQRFFRTAELVGGDSASAHLDAIEMILFRLDALLLTGE